MIDAENEIFTKVAETLRPLYEGIFITGEEVAVPPRFPCVSLVQMSNPAHRRTQDSGSLENHAEPMFQGDIYSNLETGRKSQCKAIAATVDSVLQELGFTRIFLESTPNADSRIYRMTGRWKAVIGKDLTVYRA